MIARRDIVLGALAGPALLSARSQAQGRRVIRAVPIGDLRILDPIWTTAYITRNHGYLVWDTLFALDEQGVPRPQMVDSFEVSPDRLTWNFTLRPGMLWHDGGPVRAADCVASIRRWGARDGMGQALMSVTHSLEALDERSFRLVLSRPVAFVLEALGKIDSNVPFMMPERLAQTSPNTAIREMIGSGPFRFLADEWMPGAKVVYERFDRYVPRAEPASGAAGGKVAKVDRVEMSYTPDAATAASGLVTGEFDIVESPAPDLLGMLRRARGVKVGANDPLGYGLFAVLNHLHPPFDKVEARRALMMAIRQADFMQATVGDESPWRECAAVFGCAAQEDARREELGWPPYDLARARALFAASGYDGRPVLVMDPADLATLHPSALLLAEALRNIGANVNLLAMDWSALVARRSSRAPVDQGGWNLYATNATMTGIATPLTNNFVRNCEQASFGWPCDRQISAMSEAWTFETDEARRRSLMTELNRLHIRNVTTIPLGQYRSAIAYREGLRGLIPAPAVFYWNVEKA
ncbi:ABC transporter substrate-binding protein [Roseococcus pinisoli]|uniref:ABC transporter substrate-binding protein n=1 Tax=Roseococcus pinisoli TaxID=2835040 RepID=A0ABS5QDW2_9PROT|nr:ABC transporter substrate-binding protein [Roseococcus pinisoli]MBS7811889.1 ABC transporter substrate-binding protein [Roseococcus pinisoli]